MSLSPSYWVKLLFSAVTGAISAVGYPAVIALMALESACIPIPSEIIMPFAGYLVYTGRFSLFGAALAGALGCALGSALAYWVGSHLGYDFVRRYGKYLLIREHEIESAEKWFNKYGQWAALISRMLPIIRTFISLPAGVARMSFPTFLLFSFVGSFPWCYLLAYGGYLLGKNWMEIRHYLHSADVVIVFFGLLAIAWWIKTRRRMKEIQ